MPINSFNVGRDVAIDFVGPNGPIRVSILTDFHSKPMVKKQESHGLDGIVRFQYIPGGWEGSFKIDRANRAADDFVYNNEQLYYAGQNVPSYTLVETITEPDGSTSQWRYVGVQVAMSDHGNWRGDSKVEQSLEFCASQRQRVQ